MSPEPAPGAWFGRTPAQAARGAVVLAALGFGAVLVVHRLLTVPGSVPGRMLEASGLPDWAPLAAGGIVVAVLAVYGCWKSSREAPRFRVDEGGFHVSTRALGTYLLRWENVRGASVTPGGLAFRVADRAAAAATHAGTPAQRELLLTQEPFGDWDFLYPAAELGRDPGQVLEWCRPYLRAGAAASGG